MERHIVGLADRLWKVTAVQVTTWHIPCAQYDIYELPEESHYFLVIFPLIALIS